MRTFVLAVVLCLVAAAAGLSLLLDAGAERGGRSATLAYSCDPARIPSGVTTLVTCRFTATNTGSEPLEDLLLGFSPASGLPIPDLYYFVSWTLDGAAQPHSGPYDLAYEYGDVAPGQRKTIELRVILRSDDAEYGAGATLTEADDADFTQLAAVTVRGMPGPAETPPIEVKVERQLVEYPVEGRGPQNVLSVMVTNRGDDPLDDVTLELAHQDVPWVPMPGKQPWGRPNGVDGRIALRIGTIEPSRGLGFTAQFAPAADTCTSFLPAAIVTYGDPPRTVAYVPESYIEIGLCPAVEALPAGGGGTASTNAGRPPATGLLLLGIVLLCAGVAMRRAAWGRTA